MNHHLITCHSMADCRKLVSDLKLSPCEYKKEGPAAILVWGWTVEYACNHPAVYTVTEVIP